jgi:hypothetical protein
VSKQRETVKRSINRAIKTIAAKHPVLAEHLRASVVRSTVFAYRPDRTISWRIEFPDKAAGTTPCPKRDRRDILAGNACPH